MPGRQGWPTGMVERAECANCGRHGYSAVEAPHRSEVERFGQWVRGIWAGGSALQTVFGFFIWCGGDCRSVWFEKRQHVLDHPDTAVLAHQREMQRRRAAAGVG